MANGTREYSKHHKGQNRSASWRPGGRRQASTAGAERPQPNTARRPRNPYKVTITRMSCPETTNVGGPPLGRVCECANMLWNKHAIKSKYIGVPRSIMAASVPKEGHLQVPGVCRQALSIRVPPAETSTHLASASASHRGAAARLLDQSELDGLLDQPERWQLPLPRQTTCRS